MNEKKCIAPNECSALRWIMALAVTYLIGIVASMPLTPLMNDNTNSFLGISFSSLFSLLSFVPMMIGLFISVKFIAKTPIKNFIFGAGEKITKKTCLIVFILFTIGFYIPILAFIGNVKANQVDVGQYCLSFVLLLVLAAIQTSFEELAFRGFFIRWACKNNIGYSKKAMVALALCSVFFMLSHITNKEVTSQQGIDMLFAILAYLIPGIAYFVADLHFGSLLPGMIMHMVNNFTLFTIINADVSTVTSSVLFTDTTPSTGGNLLLSVILSHAPILIYILIDIIRRKKAAKSKEK